MTYPKSMFHSLCSCTATAQQRLQGRAYAEQLLMDLMMKGENLGSLQRADLTGDLYWAKDGDVC